MAVKPATLISNMVQYTERRGAWYTNQFHYQAWMRQADILKSDLTTLEKGLYIEALTYYIFGKIEYALEISSILMKYHYNRNYLTIYTTSLFMLGRIDESINAFRNHHIDSSDIIVNARDYCRIAEYANMNFDINSAKEFIQLISYSDNPTINTWIQGMDYIIEVTEQNLLEIANANLQLDLVKEVMSISIRLLCSKGNYPFITKFQTHMPNDVLYITFICNDLSLDDMDELNYAWIETMVNHESSYSFLELSRISVNYQPSIDESEVYCVD